MSNRVLFKPDRQPQTSLARKMTKQCSVCKKELPLDAFSKDKRLPHGITGKCKQCKSNQDWRRNGKGTPQRNWTKADLNILSLGAGIRSSTLLLMSATGKLPKLDAAIFADTKMEPPAVYSWLHNTLIPEANKANIPIHIVENGNIQKIEERTFIPIPAYTIHDEKKSILRRQCTNEFKITPIRTKIWELSDHRRKKVDQWIGISADEIGRMSESDVLYMRNTYPLIELNLTREDCQQWLTEHGYGPAPKSSCICCPYRSDLAWKEMKEQYPATFQQAVEFEQKMQKKSRLTKTYLHNSRQNLDQVVFKSHPGGEECTGYCWT